MAYPYKKMDEEDFAYIRSVTAGDRVWVGEEIGDEYYRDEMPEYGVYPPELYVEVIDKEEISKIMAYAYEKIFPWCAGEREPAWQGAPPVSTGHHAVGDAHEPDFPGGSQNQTITVQPGALLLDVQAAAAAEGLFYPVDPGRRRPPSEET